MISYFHGYKNSNTFAWCWGLSFLLCQFYDLLHFFADPAVIFPAVRYKTAGTIFDSIFGITKAAAAVFPQAVQRTIAEQAAKGCRIRTLVAGKIFAFLMLKKVEMGHNYLSSKLIPGINSRGVLGKFHPAAGFRMAKADFMGPKCDFTGIFQNRVFPFSH